MASVAPAGVPCVKCPASTERMATHEHTDRDDPGIRRLVEDLQAGRDREESFRQLFAYYYPPLRNFFSRRGMSPEECRDLVQETFTNVFKAIGRFHHDARFDTWLYKIAGNVWKNALRG